MSSSVHLAQDLIRTWQTSASPGLTDQPPPARALPTEQVVSLAGPGRPPAQLNLEQTLRRRRSLRFFAQSPLPAAHVGEVITAGLAEEKQGRDQQEAELPELEITIAALRVEGLDRGFHQITPSTQTAAKIAVDFDPSALESLTLQAEFADAAVIISLGADLAAAEARAGTHGYRLLMGRVSAAAYAMWLQGVSRGWVGSVFAGLLPAALRQPVASDGTSRHQLFALALGPPPKVPANAAPDPSES
ncbi:nitroreductase family protein [Nesterenkonia alkaliphila]|uniref:Nitroreductase domain-containing protein n=1 Tax=Nesterenkonia alkaliphila TaxID=1463631 RepID=A0A7K1UJD7_9MICC|nr:nitroreductase family protein [Nesterenkonia alkaliphila]MVT26526.1 hypothetical protein [Nesterenkonia alkaliphila]GFZ79131.1 hypothetical protein GCM10011359_04400 [Nesterenkonia alkaliphila]